jgi:proteasome lid subunit RPN8/RPN11
MKLFRRRITISITTEVIGKINIIAKDALPKESGGLLLGWWDKNMIIISNAVEVNDPGATVSSWMRQEVPSQAVLDNTIKNSKDGALGYVGDWHSHTAVSSASSQDINSLHRASQQYRHPLALIVWMPNNQLEFYVAKNGAMRRARLINVT